MEFKELVEQFNLVIAKDKARLEELKKETETFERRLGWNEATLSGLLDKQ